MRTGCIKTLKRTALGYSGLKRSRALVPSDLVNVHAACVWLVTFRKQQLEFGIYCLSGRDRTTISLTLLKHHINTNKTDPEPVGETPKLTLDGFSSR